MQTNTSLNSCNWKIEIFRLLFCHWEILYLYDIFDAKRFMDFLQRYTIVVHKFVIILKNANFHAHIYTNPFFCAVGCNFLSRGHAHTHLCDIMWIKHVEALFKHNDLYCTVECTYKVPAAIFFVLFSKANRICKRQTKTLTKSKHLIDALYD